MTEQSVFVSGDFGPSPDSPWLVGPPVAIEILREFAPQEFIGKVYIQRGTEWVPVSPEGASYWWYKRYQERQEVYFDMKGSERWEIEWFRFESSTRSPNPYLAVALQQKGTKKAHVPSAILGT